MELFSRNESYRNIGKTWILEMILKFLYLYIQIEKHLMRYRTNSLPQMLYGQGIQTFHKSLLIPSGTEYNSS